MGTQKQPNTATVKGPEKWFTGGVYFNAYYTGQAPSRAWLNLVRFTPGAHTAWHEHAVGQTLHITESSTVLLTGVPECLSGKRELSHRLSS